MITAAPGHLVEAEKDVGHLVHAGCDGEGVAAGFGEGCGPVAYGCIPLAGRAARR